MRPTFINVGERTNVTGSAKFRKLVVDGNYSAALDVARNYGVVLDHVLPFDSASLYQDTEAAFYATASRLKIALGLRAKGVDGDLARTAIEEDGTDEMVAALRFCRRRRIGPWRRGERPDRDGLNNEIATLARQGFATQLGRAVVLLSLEDAEEKLGAI